MAELKSMFARGGKNTDHGGGRLLKKKKSAFAVHPLFVIFGIYFAFTGKVYSFLIFTLSAVLHEMGHALAAAERGYKLNRLVLMPYGAVICGNLGDDMTYSDEVFIALAGPFTNLIVTVIFVSLWWFMPAIYPYTEVVVLANLTIATVNLMPSYPLDGGRVFLSMLSVWLKRKTAYTVCRVTGILFSLFVGAVFAYSAIIGQVNFSILFFALFMLFGNIFVSKENRYVRIASFFTLGNLTRGKKITSVAVYDDIIVKDLIHLYRYGELSEFVLFSRGGKKTIAVPPERVIEIITCGALNEKVVTEYKRLYG